MLRAGDRARVEGLWHGSQARAGRRGGRRGERGRRLFDWRVFKRRMVGRSLARAADGRGAAALRAARLPTCVILAAIMLSMKSEKIEGMPGHCEVDPLGLTT